ncbi:MAG: hypothetical protein EOO88_49385 [Pedobacter sp.]|nr:MAG: hypothetical protein EOO88_49385 [Pedobacter sp.]
MIKRKHTLVRYGVILSCLLNLIVMWGGEANGQGLSVAPSRIFFKGKPGQTVTESITFTNNSNKTLTFTSAIKDWERDSLGTKVYYPASKLKESNGNWLSLSESTIVLAPGQTKQVALNMQIPTNAIAMSQSMVFFTQANEQRKVDAQVKIGLNVLLEVGVQVYHVPDGLLPGTLEFLAFDDRGIKKKDTASVRAMRVKVKNNGQLNKDAYVRFELTNIETGEEITIKPIAIAMLPNAVQSIQLELPGNLKGRYLVVSILDAGSQYSLKVAEKEIIY